VSSTSTLAPQGPQQVTTPNLNNFITGSGQRAIKIQDLVRQLNKQYILSMNISEQIKYVFEKLEALNSNIDELKREIEELKYFNRVLSYRLREIHDF